MSYDATVCRFRCTICRFRCHFIRSVLKITLGIIALQKKLDIHRALEYYIISGLYYSDTRSLNAPKAITEPEFGNPVSS